MHLDIDANLTYTTVLYLTTCEQSINRFQYAFQCSLIKSHISQRYSIETNNDKESKQPIMMGTQSNNDNTFIEHNNIVANQKQELSPVLVVKRKPARNWRNIVFKNNKKISTVSESTTTAKTEDDSETKQFRENKINTKVRWNKCKHAVNKKMKDIAKELEIQHHTQPEYSAGPLWMAYNPTGYGY